MTESVLRIDGMKCGDCLARVREALEDIEGVQDVDVSLDAGRARVTADEDVERSAMEEAVRRAGFVAIAGD